MTDMPDCTAAAMVDQRCYRRPVFVLTTDGGEQSLACGPHVEMLLHQALSGLGEVAVTAYDGN